MLHVHGFFRESEVRRLEELHRKNKICGDEVWSSDLLLV